MRQSPKPDLRTLYCTTAWLGQSQQVRDAKPPLRGLFKVRVEAPGLPQYLIRL